MKSIRLLTNRLSLKNQDKRVEELRTGKVAKIWYMGVYGVYLGYLVGGSDVVSFRLPFAWKQTTFGYKYLS